MGRFSVVQGSEVSAELLDLVTEDGWLQPAGEALAVCQSHLHSVISDWDAVRNRSICPRCQSDSVRLLPCWIEADVKTAVNNCVVVELSIAEAFRRADGEPFVAPGPEGHDHTVGMDFPHPMDAGECDVIGEVGDITYFVECKDPREGNTLNPTGTTVARERIEYLVEQVQNHEDSVGDIQTAMLLVTTREAHDNVRKLVERKGPHGDVPMHLVEGNQLPELHTILREQAGN